MRVHVKSEMKVEKDNDMVYERKRRTTLKDRKQFFIKALLNFRLERDKAPTHHYILTFNVNHG